MCCSLLHSLPCCYMCDRVADDVLLADAFYAVLLCATVADDVLLANAFLKLP